MQGYRAPSLHLYISLLYDSAYYKNSFYKKNFFFSISPLLSVSVFHVFKNGATFLPCAHGAVSTVRSGFWLCLKVTFSVITSHTYACGYLISCNPILIGIIFLSLALMERCKEAALDWLSEMSPSYQELVFCWILPTELLEFEEYEMLQSSQMAHVKGKKVVRGSYGLLWFSAGM